MLPNPTAPATRRIARRPGLRALTSLGAASALSVSALAGAPTFAASGDNQVLIDVVERGAPTVVTIVVTTGGVPLVSRDYPIPEGADPGAGGGTTDPLTPQATGSGSGVIIDPSGLILTNRHVAGDATSVTVIFADGRTFPGETVGVDTLTDFAFVKIDATDLPTATLGDSSAIQVGQLAIAMGNPLGEFPGTVTTGIVSGLDRTIDVSNGFGQGSTTLRHLIQTDASINPGNSGGPLLDGDGSVIGINTAKGGMSTGIGFALPIDLAKPIIAQVLAGQPIERPYIGIMYQGLDAQVAADNSLAVDAGAWIHADAQSGQSAIVADGPAMKAGLKNGDIITSLDGQAIDAQHQLDLLLLQHAPSDTVTLTVLRDGQTLTIDLTLGTRPAPAA